MHAQGDEDKPQKQKIAICFSTWRESKKSDSVYDVENDMKEYNELLEKFKECPECEEKKKESDCLKSLFTKIHTPTFPIEFIFTFPIQKRFDEERVIAGYASVQRVDSQGEEIPIEGLKEAWERCYRDGKVQLHLMHSNIPIGEILKEHKDLVSGVDEIGLFIVGKIWDNTNMANEAWARIKDGTLGSFSIGGEALAKTLICDTETGKQCHARIDRLDLHEISIVDNPANKSAIFNILKFDELLEKYDKWVKNVNELVLHARPSGDEALIPEQKKGDSPVVLGGQESQKKSELSDSMVEEKKDQIPTEPKVEKDAITLDKVWARLDKFEDILNRLLPKVEVPVEKKEEKKVEELDINGLVDKKLDERIRKIFEEAPSIKRSVVPEKEEPINSPLDFTTEELLTLDEKALMKKAGFVPNE